MAWIVAAVGADDGRLPQAAVEEFRRIAALYPAAPWKIETGHLRSGRERLEQITGRSWQRVELSAEAVREDVETLLANAALASPGMQAAVPRMTIAARQGLGAMRKPLWLIYGARDALVRAEPSLERARQLDPRVRGSVYAASGHAPFVEEAERFNRDLAAFVDAAAGR